LASESAQPRPAPQHGRRNSCQTFAIRMQSQLDPASPVAEASPCRQTTLFSSASISLASMRASIPGSTSTARTFAAIRAMGSVK
jgi:hypothetical protein